MTTGYTDDQRGTLKPVGYVDCLHVYCDAFSIGRKHLADTSVCVFGRAIPKTYLIADATAQTQVICSGISSGYCRWLSALVIGAVDSL